MRTLCPNLDREDGLETVLEVPIPEEMFPCTKQRWQWQNQMKSWMIKPTAGPFRIGGRGGGGGGSGGGDSNNNSPDRNSHIQLLLGVIGSPLIPLPATSSTASTPLSLASYRHRTHEIKDNPIEASMAKYIVQQYVAAMGGSHALNSIESMYAMGKVKMTASEFSSGEVVVNKVKTVTKNGNYNNNGEIGGFVLWQKRPDLWSLELVVSGCKISAGSDGKVAWRQTPWHHSHASRGPARPLRRSLQGLDPRLTASLFTNAVCIGEKSINNEDCFILRVEAAHSTLHARSSSNVEIIRHTVWGYFSQRTGLLIQLEDTHLLRIKPLSAPKSTDQSIFWETTMESSITDYKTIDGVNIAHGGKTAVSLYRYADEAESSSRTRMEEVWSIVEVDFNIKGLEVECFLPPSDLKREDEEEVGYDDDDSTRNGMNLVGATVINPLKKTVASSPPPQTPPSMMLKPRGPPPKISLAKIMAIDDDDLEMYGGRKDDSSADHDQSKER